ncbi:MAG TPA: prepilin-type N-terminal cleavage/methylation domain-containing protein [Sedimentisphaerales bacterium]|nr:prepilin-type N-terminal cleavage/methylation domain-containing protein [Sedimentisphaerales bacterium]
MKTNDIFSAAARTLVMTSPTVAKRKRSAFTLVELLTVLAIITMLVALFVPSLNMARRIAKETKQKSQLAAIESALTTFRNDNGDYPPSFGAIYSGAIPQMLPYCGAQKLTEALLGWDLMGFHPRSAWRADGRDIGGGSLAYDPDKLRGDDSLYERRGRYIELEGANAFRLGDISPDKPGLFPVGPGMVLAPDTFVLCDVFGAKRITLAKGKTVNAGAPVLYYRANTSSKTIDPAAAASYGHLIYDFYDNHALVVLQPGSEKYLGNNDYTFFYEEYIRDPRVPGLWPYRPDSFILISAGVDGIYGTADDIRNFGN